MLRFAVLLRGAVSVMLLASVLGPVSAKADSGAAESSGLREVLACPAVTSCWAVDETNPDSLLHGNGRSWSRLAVPLPHGPSGSRVGASLHHVLCLSVSNCWAVGGYGIENGTTITYGYLTEHWNGKAWHYVPAPLPASAVGSLQAPGLEGISCISATNCWAVGSAGGTASASHWDGHHWLPRAVGPLTAPDTDVVLYDVSCAGFACWAVGTGHGYQFKPAVGTSSSYVVLHVVNGRWVKAASPVQPVSAMEDTVHISCPASNSCWVAGTRYDPRTFSPHTGLAGQLNDVLHWNGKHWASVPVPSPGGHVTTDVHGLEVLPASALLDLTCVSVDDCWAVGAYTRVANPPLVRGQVLHWNGHTWSVLAAPKPVGAVDAGLVGVSCPKGHGCAVLGYGVTHTVVGLLLARRVAGHWAY